MAWKRINTIFFVFVTLVPPAINIVIDVQVDNVTRVAQGRYGGSRTPALLELAASDESAFRIRNRAVWALGRIGDPEALPTLEALVTSAECDHDRVVCQREVKKAIDRCRDR